MLNVKNEEGQAIFEFIVFLPLIIYLFTVMTNVGDAINASINQQKATRGYFYGTIRGNSSPTFYRDLLAYGGNGRQGVGLIAFGWRLKGEDDVGENYSSCYPFSPFLGIGDRNETCEKPIVNERKTSIIRVSTLYGICGEYYKLVGNNWQVGLEERSSLIFCSLTD